jgi:hypothetical protein
MAEGRGKTTKERLDKHDRQIAAIRDLVQEGMRLVIQTRRDFRTLHTTMNELAAQQKKTEAALAAFLENMNRGGNGHAKRKLDLH